MAIALKVQRPTTRDKSVVLQQLLHGYEEGHRLIEGSINVPDDLTRLMLRLSDLSGSNVTSGFEEYLTGYPLVSLHAYALAKTWYAPEMPRPGCVWTHTVVIPSAAMSQLTCLDSLLPLFKRPSGETSRGSYAEPLILRQAGEPSAIPPLQAELMQTLVSLHYGKENAPVVLAAQTSMEFENLILAFWSQKWPSLRMSYTFCTGALSARTFNRRPFDVQCVPAARAREVILDTAADGGITPVVANSVSSDPPSWVIPAAIDASDRKGGPLREFLWAVSNDNSERIDFRPFVTVFGALNPDVTLTDLIALVVKLFPNQVAGHQLKCMLFGKREDYAFLPNHDEQDVLFALATTSEHEHFDGDALSVRERGEKLCLSNPDAASCLVGELFRSTLNPLGEKILAGLISAMEAETARRIVSKHMQFLPALFRVKPSLASSPQLWLAGGDRKRELFEAVAAHEDMDSTLLRGIIDALFESGSDAFIGRALDRWGKVAIFQALDWAEAHSGTISPACCEALKSHLSSVVDWVEAKPSRSFESLLAIAHVVAPFSSEISERDTSVWFPLLHHLRDTGNEAETTYICAFLLALALGNAPPSPLKLISESFERIHEAARRDILNDAAWIIVEPRVPELSWVSNWDKCERLRRGLISAFVRYGWPPIELKRRIKDRDLLRELLRSARRVDGGEELAREVSLSG